MRRRIRVIFGFVFGAYGFLFGPIKWFLDWYGRGSTMSDLITPIQEHFAAFPAMSAMAPWFFMFVGGGLLGDAYLLPILRRKFEAKAAFEVLFNDKSTPFYSRDYRRKISAPGWEDYISHEWKVGIKNNAEMTIYDVGVTIQEEN
ncbi:MAG TPA: hypothetical protein VME45_01020, partial [Stellaceae bacterium]|nr:hypothetical protein [Stellaceae bacterium]